MDWGREAGRKRRETAGNRDRESWDTSGLVQLGGAHCKLKVIQLKMFGLQLVCDFSKSISHIEWMDCSLNTLKLLPEPTINMAETHPGRFVSSL